MTTGHYKADCWAGGGKKKVMGKGADKGKEEDAAVVAKAKGDEDATWLATVAFNSLQAIFDGRAVG